MPSLPNTPPRSTLHKQRIHLWIPIRASATRLVLPRNDFRRARQKQSQQTQQKPSTKGKQLKQKQQKTEIQPSKTDDNLKNGPLSPVSQLQFDNHIEKLHEICRPFTQIPLEYIDCEKNSSDSEDIPIKRRIRKRRAAGKAATSITVNKVKGSKRKNPNPKSLTTRKARVVIPSQAAKEATDNIPETNQPGPSGRNQEKRPVRLISDVVSDEKRKAFFQMLDETKTQRMTEWLTARDAYCRRRELQAATTSAIEPPPERNWRLRREGSTTSSNPNANLFCTEFFQYESSRVPSDDNEDDID